MTIFELNILSLHIAPTYYGLMYALAFLTGYYYLLKKEVVTKPQLESLFLYLIAWVVLWGRIWYIIFYDLSYYLADPINIIKVWEGGMSFHWGALGVIIATLAFAKIHKVQFLKLIDEIVFILPIWLFLGRIWNYLNKELLGFPYTWFLAVEKNGQSYFPSPLLEAFLEGIILFMILYFVSKRKTFYGQIWCVFLIFYGLFRLLVEIFVRTPDAHIWYISWFFTMWSLLSLPMIIVGIILYFFFQNRMKINSQK